MKGKTSFEGAIFKTEPPQFFGAKLHQGTVWRGITWPRKRKDKGEAGEFIDAYACLKLEMGRLKKHEDELDFFAREVQSRRVLLGPWRGPPIWLYGVLSDYGRSYARPFLRLLVVAAIGAMLLVFSDALTIEKSFGLSAANTLNVFGFRRDFDLAIDTLPAWLKAVAAVQTIFGTILRPRASMSPAAEQSRRRAVDFTRIRSRESRLCAIAGRLMERQGAAPNSPAEKIMAAPAGPPGLQISISAVAVSRPIIF
jgi:hypothetical protein